MVQTGLAAQSCTDRGSAPCTSRPTCTPFCGHADDGDYTLVHYPQGEAGSIERIFWKRFHCDF